jgi:hypothetical protein
MKPASFLNERLYLTDPTDARIPPYATVWDRIVATLINPEFLVIVVLCGVGLLATTILSVAAPSFVESFTSLQQFL